MSEKLKLSWQSLLIRIIFITGFLVLPRENRLSFFAGFLTGMLLLVWQDEDVKRSNEEIDRESLGEMVSSPEGADTTLAGGIRTKDRARQTTQARD